MNTDVFITQAFTYSQKSHATIKTYQAWIGRLCQHAGKPHPLDINVADIQAYYLYLHDERQYSRSSLEIVRAALKYTYCVLLREEVPKGMRCDKKLSELVVKRLFSGRRSYANKLPVIATETEINDFIMHLPSTNAGAIIKKMYTTGKPLDAILADIAPLKVSKAHIQQVCRKIARQVGIAHGFGLRGVRATGIVHRIRCRENDLELKAIMQDAGVSSQQFRLYRKVAGDFIREK